jgi:hypothetical protein
MFRSSTPGSCPTLERLEPRKLFASAPLLITHGGIYTGSYSSSDSNIPVITIQTAEPVTIKNATLTGPGDLIFASVPHANITIRNTKGYSTNPNIAGKAKGRFLDADGFDNAVIENNYLEGTAGIFLLDYGGDRTPLETVRVFGNRARNIDGRLSDGKGGYLDFNTRISKIDNHAEDGFKEVQFLQLNKVINVPNIDISFNEVINEPGNSRVEDNISIYKSSGTSNSPILIHDNYIQGAYTIKPWQKSHSDDNWTWDWSYSGGGILLSDGLGDSGPAGDPAFVKAFDNQVVSTTNYGIAISTGHDIEFSNNRVVSSGILADGRAIAAQNVGAYVWDSTEVGAGRFFNNTSRANVLGWNVGETRNDWWIPNSALNLGNIHWPKPITRDDETVEASVWLKKMYAKFPDRQPPAPKLSVSGMIFNDVNGDAIRGSKETGITGFRVYLDKNNNKKFDKGEIATRSSSTGRYSFYDLPAAAYTVRITPVEGWRDTQGSFARVAVKATAASTRYFGFTRNGLATGVVFLDANRDGVINKGEPGLVGWRIFADLDGDGVLDKNEPTAITNQSGVYALSLSTGTYIVRVVKQSSYKGTTPAARSVTLAQGAAVALNFGEKRIA